MEHQRLLNGLRLFRTLRMEQARLLAGGPDTAAAQGDADAMDSLLSETDHYLGLRMLPFSIVATDGGEFSPQYKCANLLRPDRLVYCSTKKANVNVLFEICEPDDLFVLTHVIVRAPKTGFTSPIREGVVFVFHERPSLDDVASYDDVDEVAYEGRLSRKRDCGQEIQETDPAAFFVVDRKTSEVLQPLPAPRAGRFVLVKLVRAGYDKNQPNVDVEFIGFKGYTQPQGSPEGSLR
eukprot:m.114659 g.114659  ORF g.114659 m.114659 type:complete len:236 (+) comp16035_c0_seq4:246-953(+)